MKRRGHDKVVPRFERKADFGKSLQGYGSPQTQRLRTFPGCKLGPANRGRRLSKAERDAVVEQMKRDGRL